MNAKTSLIVWLIAIAYTAACFVGFAHGAKLTDTEPLIGGAWMLGSLVGLAAEVFVKVKWLR